jgi:hypothetical protein
MQIRLFISTFFILVLVPFLSFSQISQRTDTLFITESKDIPIIDGQETDETWSTVDWNSIDKVWMPYNNEPSNLGQEAGLKLWEGEDDFTGKFKAIWSSETNLLYFLVEVTDDKFTGGYIYNENPNSGGGYPNYDIVEVFIDEDRSGGLHVFDGTGNTGTQWGTNAENAFSYHIATNEPENGVVQKQLHALDIAGTNWGYPNQKIPDYANHFPGFAMKKDNNKYVWEFSLNVYNDTYNPSNPEASLVYLESGKILGLSLAYCDNDNPEESPLRRDHFFGSVDVPLAAYNDHWKQADGFGVAKLTNSTTTFSSFSKLNEQIKIKSYASNGRLNISVNSLINDKVSIRILNIVGQKMIIKTGFKSTIEWNNNFDIQNLKSGIYLVEIVHGNKRITNNFIVP